MHATTLRLSYYHRCPPAVARHTQCLAQSANDAALPPTVDADAHVAPAVEKTLNVPATLLPQSSATHGRAAVVGSLSLAPFSAAPGGAGLPLFTPSSVAIVLLAILGARETRQQRGFAVEALHTFTAPQSLPTPASPPVLDAEAFEALQKADAERRAREAAAEAVREVERRRVVEAERARIEARICRVFDFAVYPLTLLYDVP